MEGLLFFLLIMYFLPALIASSRKHHNANSIFIVNLFFGWTVLGWIVSLAWSFGSVRNGAS